MQVQSFLTVLSSLSLSDPNGFTVNGKKEYLTQYINNVFYNADLGSPCRFKHTDSLNGQEIRSILKYLGFDTAIDYQYGNIPKYPSLFLSIALLKPRMLGELYSSLPSDFSRVITYKDQDGNLHKTYGSVLKLALKIEDQNKQIWQHGSIVSSSDNPIGSSDFYVWRIDRSLQENNGKLDDRKIKIARHPYKHNLESPRLTKARAKFKVRSSDLNAERHDPIYGFFVDPNLKGIIAIDTYTAHITTQIAWIYNPKHRSGLNGSIECREVNAITGSKIVKTIGTLNTKHDGKLQYKLNENISLFCQGNLGILCPRLGIDPSVKTVKTISNFSSDSVMLDPLFWHNKDLEIAVLPNKTIRFIRGYRSDLSKLDQGNKQITDTRSDRYRKPENSINVRSREISLDTNKDPLLLRIDRVNDRVNRYIYGFNENRIFYMLDRRVGSPDPIVLYVTGLNGTVKQKYSLGYQDTSLPVIPLDRNAFLSKLSTLDREVRHNNLPLFMQK